MTSLAMKNLGLSILTDMVVKACKNVSLFIIISGSRKKPCGRIYFLFFTESHLVGARKKYAQTRSTVV